MTLVNSLWNMLSEVGLMATSVLSADFYYFFFVAVTLLSLRKLSYGQWLRGLSWFALGIFWLLLFDSNIFYWISSLGQDSFAEAENFALHEALAWLYTLPSTFDYRLSVRRLILFFSISLVTFFILKRVARYLVSALRPKAAAALLYSFAALLMTLSLVVTSNNIFIAIQGTNDFISTVDKNFIAWDRGPVVFGDGPNLVLHIGESTTTMNMGLYGYFRDTTPNLSRLADHEERFLYFDNVFSTHVHTSPSLLDALSFSIVSEDQRQLPPEESKKLSIANLLGSSDIHQTLLSNQGRTGSWNLVSSIVLSSVNRKIYGDSEQPAVLGNLEPKNYKPKDDALFRQHFGSIATSMGGGSKKVVYIHGYAGHSPYLDFLPDEFKRPVDDFFTTISSDTISDRPNLGGKALIAVEQYDAAIRYVDHIIGERIDDVETLDEPYVYIFFADHGESVYTPLGHDSSRFRHEMARIPYIMFFNSAARAKYPNLFLKYSALAQSNSPATLSQLTSTLIDILNIKKENLASSLRVTPLIGQKTALSNILIRRVGKDIRYLPLSLDKKRIIASGDWVDPDTMNFSFANDADINFKICHHAANSISQILRGRLTSDCLEMDLVISDNGDLEIFHPPSPSTGLTLGVVFQNLLAGVDDLWIDAKNINDPKKCSKLQEFLQEQSALPNNLLVEFPSSSAAALTELKGCFDGLKDLGVKRSFYVPTEIALACASRLREVGREPQKIEECVSLASILRKVEKSGFFSDLGFDYAARVAVERLINRPVEFSLNSWHVPPEDAITIVSKRFSRIMLKKD